MNEEETRSSAAARALHALEPEEAAKVEAALDRSHRAVRDEADAFAETAARMGLAARPVQPSAGLRARLLADIASMPQVSPDADADAQAPGDPAEPVRPGTTVKPAAPATETRDTPAIARARARWYSNPGLVVGAAAAAVLLFAGGVAVGTVLDGENPRMEAQADSLAELYAAPDTQRSSADVEGGQTATLVWSEQLDRSVVVFDDLAPLPEGRVYEAWYINSARTATPAGTFSGSAGGLVYHQLDGSLGRGGTVGVTVEPQPGSEAPTTKPIVLLNRA